MTWKDPVRWQRMQSGEDCPFCRDIHLEANPFSVLIAALPNSWFRFARAQDPAGLCLVASKVHCTEVFQMPAAYRDGYFRDVALCAEAVASVFRPVKIHYGIFGSLCPHVHCHLMPKYEYDDPHAPVTLGDKRKVLDEATLLSYVGRLRDALESIRAKNT